MKRILLSLALMTCWVLGTQAQTKLIFHKSHSGDVEKFEEALLHDESFERSNFGRYPRPRVVNARLDSLIYTSDTSVIMVTSRYCTDPEGRYTDYNIGKHIWKPGRALVSITPGKSTHPLVNGNKVDTAKIRNDLNRMYHFRNKASTVVIIKDSLAKAEQAENNLMIKMIPIKKKKKKKQAYLPVAEEGSNMPPSMLSMILVLGVISLAIALIYQWLQPKI